MKIENDDALCILAIEPIGGMYQIPVVMATCVSCTKACMVSRKAALDSLGKGFLASALCRSCMRFLTGMGKG